MPAEHDTIYSISDNHFLCSNASFDFTDLDSIHYNRLNITWGCNTYGYSRANEPFNEEGAHQYVGKYVLDENRTVEVRFYQDDCLEIVMENPDKTFNRYIAMGATENNFVFPFGRLNYDSFANSRYQSIKISIDGMNFSGKRTE